MASSLKTVARKGDLCTVEAVFDGVEEDFSDYDSTNKKEQHLKALEEGKNPEPVEGKWIQSAVRIFLDNRQRGVSKPEGSREINQTDGFCAALPFMLKFIDKDVERELGEIVDAFTADKIARIHCLAALDLVKNVVSGMNLTQSLEALRKKFGEEIDRSLDLVDSKLNSPHENVVGGEDFIRACYNPGSFRNAVHALRRNPDSFKEPVRDTMRAGGCNCSRAVLIGAVAGALTQDLPGDWMDQTFSAQEVKTLSRRAFN